MKNNQLKENMSVRYIFPKFKKTLNGINRKFVDCILLKKNSKSVLLRSEVLFSHNLIPILIHVTEEDFKFLKLLDEEVKLVLDDKYISLYNNGKSNNTEYFSTSNNLLIKRKNDIVNNKKIKDNKINSKSNNNEIDETKLRKLLKLKNKLKKGRSI